MDPELPFEILLEIAEYFDPFVWQGGQSASCEFECNGPDFPVWHKEVLSLSLVSKSWHAAFSSLVKGFMQIQWISPDESLRAHLLHCFNHPGDLAQIHTISIPETLMLGDSSGSLTVVNIIEKVNEAARRVSAETTWLNALARQRGLSGPPTVGQSLPRHHVDCIGVEVALLLSLLPGLRNIHLRLISIEGIEKFESILYLFARAKQDSNLLTSLRRVDISCAREFPLNHRYVGPMGIEHILGLPRLRELDASGFRSLYGHTEFFVDRRTRAEIPENSSKVQHLMLRSWDGNRALLRQITGACVKLRSFELHFDARCDGLTVDANDVIYILGKHKSSLERLALMSAEGCVLANDKGTTMPIGSLKAFSALKHLDLPILLLVGKPLQAPHDRLKISDIFQDSFENELERYLKNRARHLAGAGGDLRQSLWALLTDVFPASLRILYLRENGWESGLAACWWEDFYKHADHRLPNREEILRCRAEDDHNGPENQDMKDAIGRKFVNKLRLSRTIEDCVRLLSDV